MLEDLNELIEFNPDLRELKQAVVVRIYKGLNIVRFK